MNCVGVDLICYGTEEGGISRERNLSEVSVIRCIGGSEIGRWPVTDRPIIGMATRIVLSQTHEVLNTDTRIHKYLHTIGKCHHFKMKQFQYTINQCFWMQSYLLQKKEILFAPLDDITTRD